MAQYIIVNNRNRAETISEKLYDLSRPGDPATDVTKFWIGVIEHPSDGRGALVINGDDILLKQDGETTQLAEDLGEFLNNKEQSDLEAALEAAKGSRVTVLDILPQKIKDMLKTEAEMEADGWFAQQQA